MISCLKYTTIVSVVRKRKKLGGNILFMSDNKFDENIEEDDELLIDFIDAEDYEEDDSTDDLSAEAPRIKLSTNHVTIKKGESINRISYVESVTDDKDSKETLYKRIEISGDTFDKDTPGTYEQTYYVVDTDGNRSNEAKLTIVVQ